MTLSPSGARSCRPIDNGYRSFQALAGGGGEGPWDGDFILCVRRWCMHTTTLTTHIL